MFGTELPLDELPADPCTELGPGLYVEGYWHSPRGLFRDRAYPWPQATDAVPDEDFLMRLQSLIDDACRNQRKESCLGSSPCRLCGQPNGADEYTLVRGDVQFRLPGGWLHYYRDHGVQPSGRFRQFVEGGTAPSIPKNDPPTMT